jgi:hypothetical protein
VQPPRAWMMATTMRLIPPVRRRMSCCDLNHIEHTWDMLGRRIQVREPPVQNIQLEATLQREWQQLSQQDILRLTGGMRRMVVAIIQAQL